jgi:hypothetical protein
MDDVHTTNSHGRTQIETGKTQSFTGKKRTITYNHDNYYCFPQPWSFSAIIQLKLMCDSPGNLLQFDPFSLIKSIFEYEKMREILPTLINDSLVYHQQI